MSKRDVKYPEHEKLKEKGVTNKAWDIQAFLEFMEGEGYHLIGPGELGPKGPISDWVYRCWGVDPKEIEAERREMLAGVA